MGMLSAGAAQLHRAHGRSGRGGGPGPSPGDGIPQEAFAVAALGTLVGVGGARLLPPRYLAQATIWIQASEPRGADRGPIGADQLLAASAWADLLKSYVVLDSVVRELRLYLHPDRSALPALPLVGFSEPPPEPGVPVSPAPGSPQVQVGGWWSLSVCSAMAWGCVFLGSSSAWC